MKKFAIYAAVSAAVLMLLTACGGSGSSDTTTAAAGTTGTTPVTNAPDFAGVINQLVGTWEACESSGTNLSFKVQTVFTKVNSTTVQSSGTATKYYSKDCTGTLGNGPNNPEISAPVNAEVIGTKTLAGLTAYKFISIETTPEKGLLAFKNANELVGGDDKKPLDSDGYATVLSTNSILRK